MVVSNRREPHPEREAQGRQGPDETTPREGQLGLAFSGGGIRSATFNLGILQGLTEFLPISSSAHIRVIPALIGWQDPGAAFTAVIQLGTEAAVLIYFRKDIGRIIAAWTRSLTDKSMRHDPDARMGWLVIVGSIPIGVLGLTLKDQIEGPFRDLRITATMLVP